MIKNHETKVIRSNDAMDGVAYMIPNVVYANPERVPLHMHILRPWPGMTPETEHRKYPLILFIQGSAFRFPDINRKIPQLSYYARKGFVVATIEHRNSIEGHPYPAFLQDAKTALRFLRAHADEYDIDKEKVAAYGSSSGGCTALLLGLTGDEEKYKTEDYREESDAVSCVVECFGPGNMAENFEKVKRGEEFPYSEAFYALVGEKTEENFENIKDMFPVNHIVGGKDYPPFLLMHGDQDPTVDYHESEMLLEKLCDAGAFAALVRVEGAVHERNFWSQEILDEALDFMREHLL